MLKIQTQPYRVYHRTPMWIPKLRGLDKPIQPDELGWPERYQLVAKVAADSLEDAYRLIQHLDWEWWLNPEVTCLVESRSTSIGDVILDTDGIYWVVAPLGFQLLEPSE